MEKTLKEISIMRVLATLMIVACHLFSWIGIIPLAMIFNVGVQCFLVISGYLYSNKEIGNGCEFLKRRWIKLCVPMYIMCCTICVIHIISDLDYDYIKILPIYFLNLQGLGYLFKGIKIPNMNEIGQLWFLTIIMVNYVFLIVIKKFEHNKRIDANKRKPYKGYLVVFLILDCILAYFEIQLAYMLTFFLGYILGKSKKSITKAQYVLLSVSMICAMTSRLVLKFFIDGTLIYDSIVIQITHIVLAVWLLKTIFVIYRKETEFCNKLCNSKIWSFLEKNSMMIYMTHYIFLEGVLNIANLNVGIGIKLLIFVMCTGICSVLLKNVSQKAILFITKQFCRRENI